MTQGAGEDWEKAQELGRSIDPENGLYQPGGQPDALMMSDGVMVEPLGAATLPHSQRPASSLPPEVADLSTDLDLDLDVDLDAPTRPGDGDLSPNETTQPLSTDARMGDDSNEPPTVELDLPEVSDSRSGELDFELPVTTEAHPPPAASAPAPASDFGALDFELEPPTAATEVSGGQFPEFEPSAPPDDVPPVSEYGSLTDNPLERKLELAEEFRQIGDMEGARDLLEEVIAKADGALKSKAQGMLDHLA
jgi:pilus assembly protein FimV